MYIHVAFHHFFVNIAAGKSRFGSLLSIGGVPPKTDKLFMKGPGGRGEVEVAVSGVAGQLITFSPNPCIS